MKNYDKLIWEETLFVFRLAPVFVPYYCLRFFFLHHPISLRLARQTRAALIRDRTWHWWEIGFCPWFTINWMIMRFDKSQESLMARAKSCRNALEALSRVRETFAKKKDRDIHVLFELWDEFQIRDAAAFDARDKSFFMRHMGEIFPDGVRRFFEEAILLGPSDYQALSRLCSQEVRLKSDRLRRIGPLESSLVAYFETNSEMCCRTIQEFRPTILAMARRYVNNMIHFCIEYKMDAAAHAWVYAGKRIVHLQELDVTPDTRLVLLEEIRKFFDYFEQASAPVYAKYQEFAQLASKERAVVSRLPYLHRGQVGRFRFEWKGNALTIVDMHHRGSDHAYLKYENITAPKALDCLEALVKAYKESPGACVRPLNDMKWRQSMENDAADFIRCEAETWRMANPQAKDESKFHKFEFRIIPDGHELR